MCKGGVSASYLTQPQFGSILDRGSPTRFSLESSTFASIAITPTTKQNRSSSTLFANHHFRHVRVSPWNQTGRATTPPGTPCGHQMQGRDSGGESCESSSTLQPNPRREPRGPASEAACGGEPVPHPPPPRAHMWPYSCITPRLRSRHRPHCNRIAPARCAPFCGHFP